MHNYTPHIFISLLILSLIEYFIHWWPYKFLFTTSQKQMLTKITTISTSQTCSFSFMLVVIITNSEKYNDFIKLSTIKCASVEPSWRAWLYSLVSKYSAISRASRACRKNVRFSFCAHSMHSVHSATWQHADMQHTNITQWPMNN